MAALSEVTSGASKGDPIGNNPVSDGKDYRNDVATSFINSFRESWSNSKENVNVSSNGVSFGDRDTKINFKTESVEDRFNSVKAEIVKEREAEIKAAEIKSCIDTIRTISSIVFSSRISLSPLIKVMDGGSNLEDKIERIDEKYEQRLETIETAYKNMDVFEAKGYANETKESLIEQKNELAGERDMISKISSSLEHFHENGGNSQNDDLFLRVATNSAEEVEVLGSIIEGYGFDIHSDTIHDDISERIAEIKDELSQLNADKRAVDFAEHKLSDNPNARLKADNIVQLENIAGRDMAHPTKEELGNLSSELQQKISECKDVLSELNQLDRNLIKGEDRYNETMAFLNEHGFNTNNLGEFEQQAHSMVDEIRLQMQDLNIGINIHEMYECSKIYDENGNPLSKEEILSNFQDIKDEIRAYDELRNADRFGEKAGLTEEQESALQQLKHERSAIKEYLGLSEDIELIGKASKK